MENFVNELNELVSNFEIDKLKAAQVIDREELFENLTMDDISYIANNYSPTDIFDIEDIKDELIIKHNCLVFEDGDEDEIMDWVRDHYYPEDIVEVRIDWN